MAEPEHPKIEAVIAAFYAAFDNREGRAAAVGELRNLFTPEARVTRVAPGRTDIWSVEEFIAPRAAMLADGTLTDFHEWETEASTTVFDAIAGRISQYRKAGVMDGRPYGGEGRKLIQLRRDGDRWLISSVLWEDC